MSPIERLSGAIKRYFSGVVGESGVLKCAVFIAVIAVSAACQPETGTNQEVQKLSK
jgi:hypothetical protein